MKHSFGAASPPLRMLPRVYVLKPYLRDQAPNPGSYLLLAPQLSL